jgi:hypothetical protein
MSSRSSLKQKYQERIALTNSNCEQRVRNFAIALYPEKEIKGRILDLKEWDKTIHSFCEGRKTNKTEIN